MRGLHRSSETKPYTEKSQPAIGAAEREACPEREHDGGRDRAAGAAARLPFAVIGHVAHHRPQNGPRQSKRELAKHFRADDRDGRVRRNDKQRQLKTPDRIMLAIKSWRLPTRLETAVEQATPASSEASPNPLNQEKRSALPET